MDMTPLRLRIHNPHHDYLPARPHPTSDAPAKRDSLENENWLQNVTYGCSVTEALAVRQT